MRAARARRSADTGFTLVEVLVVMVVFGMLAAFSTSGWLRYQRSLEGRNASSEVVAVLRNAQERSLAEAATYCVSFSTDGRSYQLFKFSCTAGSPVGDALLTPSSRVLVSSATFTQQDGTTAREVRFYPRGAATPGRVILSRAGSNHTYTITVEGLTGRVSLTG